MIWRPTKLTPAQREERRLEAGRLLREGQLSQAEIARRVGVSRMAVTQWAQQMKRQRRGLTGLQRRVPPGRPPYLTASQWRAVLSRLKRGALQAGYATDRWTLARIRQLLKQEYGVTYNVTYLAAKLRQLGWSPQHPTRYAKERNEAVVAAWLKEHWPRIKKSPAEKGDDHLP